VGLGCPAIAARAPSAARRRTIFRSGVFFWTTLFKSPGLHNTLYGKELWSKKSHGTIVDVRFVARLAMKPGRQAAMDGSGVVYVKQGK
jgi:hypothetical protein